MTGCDCKDFEIKNDRVVCKKCGRHLKSYRKEQTNIARRHKNTKRKEREEETLSEV